MIKRFFIDLFLILSMVMLLYVRYINITIYGVRPDILLVFVILIALFEEENLHSIFLGFLGGMAMDFMSGSTPLGFNAGIYLLIGYAATAPHRFFNAESILALILSLTGFFAVHIILYLGFGYLFLSSEEMVGYFNISILYKYIYTLAISLILFPIFRSIYQFISSVKKHDA
ncbi:MAG: rod shape-determining protein MreD [Spirochaetales bacterium]|nr:rod shape-determining protein MreD [Spirochaetales bacterium]